MSSKDESKNWHLHLPLVCHTDGYDPRFSTHDESRERVDYLTNRRNQANSLAVSKYPDAEHILAIDSYYLGCTEAILELVERYEALSSFGECILGASTWYYDFSRIRPRIRFYDIWSTPEMKRFIASSESRLPLGLTRVSSVGACYIYPVWIWEKYRYQVPDDFPHGGIFHNWLCKNSGLPVYLDYRVRLWRDHTNSDVPKFSWVQRIRGTLRMKHRVDRFLLWKETNRVFSYVELEDGHFK